MVVDYGLLSLPRSSPEIPYFYFIVVTIREIPEFNFGADDKLLISDYLRIGDYPDILNA